MNIGLYDMDLFHFISGKNKYPNLELMKTFNYYYSKGHKIKLMLPQDDCGRFDKIIYFKEYYETNIPNNINLIAPNVERYGYGFYGAFYPLEEPIQSFGPSYLCYEPFREKFPKSVWAILNNSSYLRFENMDFTNYNKNKSNIIIADANFFEMPDADLFLDKYVKKLFLTKHKIVINSEEIYWKFYKYILLSYRHYHINFKPSERFFKEGIESNIHWNFNLKYKTDTNESQIMRAALVGLCYKIKKYKLFSSGIKDQNSLLNKINIWATDSKNYSSFYEYYKDDKEIVKIVNNAPPSLYSILKTSPEKIKISNIDFKNYL